MALIRSGYQHLKEDDIPTLLALFDDDVEVLDPFYDTAVRGKEEVFKLWQKREAAGHSVIVGDIIEIGSTVIAAVHHDFYDRAHGRLGPGVAEVHRFTFSGDRVSRVEITTLDDLPEEVRQLFA